MAKKPTAPVNPSEAAELRRCVGSKTFGIEPHDELIGNFPAQPSRKDGLGVMCKPHWSQYVKALRERAKARTETEPAPEPITEAVPAARGPRVKKADAAAAPAKGIVYHGTLDADGKLTRLRREVVDATDAQKAEIADLEAQVKAAGGEGTDEGQALLEAAAERSAAMRNGRTAKEAMPVETPLGEQIDSGTEEADAA